MVLFPFGPLGQKTWITPCFSFSLWPHFQHITTYHLFLSYVTNPCSAVHLSGINIIHNLLSHKGYLISFLPVFPSSRFKMSYYILHFIVKQINLRYTPNNTPPIKTRDLPTYPLHQSLKTSNNNKKNKLLRLCSSFMCHPLFGFPRLKMEKILPCPQDVHILTAFHCEWSYLKFMTIV